MTFVEASEQQLVELLATFARTVGPGAMAAQVPTNVPPVLDAVGKPGRRSAREAVRLALVVHHRQPVRNESGLRLPFDFEHARQR